MSYATQFKLILNLTGNKCKDLRIEEISNKREVRVTIRATEFCTFVSDEENTLEDHRKVIIIINAGIYRGISKYNSCRFRNKTSNLVKFTKLKEISFYNR